MPVKSDNNYSHRAGLSTAMCLRLIFLCSLATAVVAASVSPDEAVMTALKLDTEYKLGARPPPDNGTANTINVFVYLNTLAKVDATNQEITTRLLLEMYWIDSRLSWLGKFNSSLDNISFVHIPQSMHWKPDITFYDALSVSSFSDSEQPSQVWRTGQVLIGRALIVTSKCKLDMRYFPFDTQACYMGLMTMQQIVGVILVKITPVIENETTTTLLRDNNEFCVFGVDLYLVNRKFYERPEVRILFQRIPTFYIVNLMLPSVLLLAISVIVFRLPPECGERVSFSITIVLSMTVFLQLAGNYTPTQSESVPLITYYTMASMLLTMLNVLCNAFVLICHSKQRSSSRVSNRLIRALFLNRIVTGRISPRKEAADDAAAQQQQQSSSASFHGNDWETVVSVADSMFFWLFIALTIIILAASLSFQAMHLGKNCLRAP